MNRLIGELMRKAVHISMGGFALLFRWITPGQAAILALVALLFNLFVLHRLTRRTLLRKDEHASGFSLGIALYPAAVLAVIVVFRERMELAAAVWGLLAFGGSSFDPEAPVNLVRDRGLDGVELNAGVSINLGFGGSNGALIFRRQNQG